MSKKFTGITSAGSAIPVYDKDAHEQLSGKQDTLTFDYNADSAISAINGSALAGKELNVTTNTGTFTVNPNTAGVPVDVIYPTDVAKLGTPSAFLPGAWGNWGGNSGADPNNNGSYLAITADTNTPGYTFNNGDIIEVTIPNTISGVSNMAMFYLLSDFSAPTNGPQATNTVLATNYKFSPGTYRLTASTNPTPNYGTVLALAFYRGSNVYGPSGIDDITLSKNERNIANGVELDLSRYNLSANTTYFNVSATPSGNIIAPSYYFRNSAEQGYGAALDKRLVNSQYYGNYSLNNFVGTVRNIGEIASMNSADKVPYVLKSVSGNGNRNSTSATFSRIYNDATSGLVYEERDFSWSSNSYTAFDPTAAYAVRYSAINDLTNYIPYSASGVSLPNSKFEIDTEGQAYKVISEGSESDYGSGAYSWSDGAIYFHPPYSQVGTYTATFPSNTDHLSVSQGGGIGFTYTFDSTTHTATFNVSALPNGAYAYVWAKDSNDYYIGIGSNNTPVKYIIPAVIEEYITDADLSEAISSISGFATTADIESAVSSKMDTSGMTAYQTVEDMSAYQPSGNYQIAGDYYSASNPSGFIDANAISGKQDALTFGYNGSNAISSINGSALAGGNTPSMTGYVPYSATSLAIGSAVTADDYSKTVAIGVKVNAQGGGLAQGDTVSARYNSLAVGNQVSAYSQSLAVGYNVSANNYGHAVGYNLTALSESFANGYNVSSNENSIANGNRAYASRNSIADGEYASADAKAIAVGTYVSAGTNAVSVGGNMSGYSQSLAVGGYSLASSDSMVVGESNTAKRYSMAVGLSNFADSAAQALGQYLSAKSGMAIGYCNYDSNAAFVIGRGSDPWNHKKDIFRINQSGDAYKVTGENAGTQFKYINESDLSGDGSAITSICGSAVGGGGGVPQSAFDAATAKIAELEGILSAYSGQWLLA